ncbi:MAG: alpha/beta fold hydrolase [Anaerolineae bacterium]|nr:alpha/beta fold hydrolase [Anaerolineae bacterium]
MDIDLELYRYEVRISNDPLIRLSAIDIHPDHAQRTIVLIHGFGGSVKQWHYQLQEFALNNRVIALDLRGHGRSDKPHSKYTMAEIQGDLEAAVEQLKVDEKFVLIGHSFGGAVASEYAAAHPERIDRLILMASTGEFNLTPIYKIPLSLPYWVHRLIEPFTRNWLGAPPRVMKTWHDNNLSKWNGWSLFRDIQVPTLVIRGNRDRVFAQQYFEEVARAIPGAEDVNVGVSGHMVMLERRQAVNRAVKRFLEVTPTSWRDRELAPDTSPRSELIKARPWLSHYEAGVPYTVSVPNIPLQHLLRSAVRRFPLRWAVIFEGYRLTYRRLNQEANRFANTLRSLGVDKGDRVMLLMPNIPQMVIAFFGTLKAGGAAVFTLPINEPEELVRQIADSGAKVLVTINQFGEAAQRALAETQLEQVIFTNVADYLPMHKRVWVKLNRKSREDFALHIELEKGMHRLRDKLYAHSKDSPQVKISPDDMAVIQYTGGTTAAAKGVMLSHRNLVANALQTRHWMPEAEEGKERFLCMIPFSHIYGLTTNMIVGIAVGATLILKANFDVEDTLNAIKTYKPTIFPGVPQMYLRISNFPGVRKYGISSINACISGSAPLPVEVQEGFEKLTRGRLVEGYGLTEAGPVTHANPLNGLRKVGSIGIPIPSTDAKIVSLSNAEEEMADGQIGELAVRGPQVMMGYWQNEQATRECILPGGWLLTGDVAQCDEQGYYRIIARKAEMWYPAKPDMPAFPRDVEEVLYEVPQVKEAAVVAIAGKPVAFVIANKDKPSGDALTAYCERRLPPELVPRLIIFLDDFPRTFIGKVLRRELARHYEQSQN